MNLFDNILVTANEVYGDVEKIFPKLDTSICRERFVDISSINLAIWKNNSLAFRLSPGIVDKKLSKHILSISKSKSDPAWVKTIRLARKQCFPLIFVSMRHHNRRWITTPREFAELFLKMSLHYPQLGLVMDGHARTENNKRNNNISILESNFIQKVSEEIEDNFKFYVSAGRKLPESIFAAGKCHCHLSQQGTSSTKSVLIANKPGVIIGPKCFGWDACNHRHQPKQCINLQNDAKDVSENLETDFYLEQELVLDSLLKITRNI